MPKLVTHRKTCRFCNSHLVKPMLRLKSTPAEQYTRIPYSPDNEDGPRFLPLHLSVCDNCSLIQNQDVVNPELLFNAEAGAGGIKSGAEEHAASLAGHAESKARLAKGSLIIDVGSGDGSVKRAFEQAGMNVITIDPGVAGYPDGPQESKHYSEFFTPELASRIAREHGQASLITANFVVGLTDNLHAFMAAGRHLLKQDGLIIIEEPCFADVASNNLFDAINHSRLTFINAGPFEKFLRSIQMHLIDAERIPYRKGALRFTVQRSDGPHTVTEQVAEFIADEQQRGIASEASFEQLAGRIEELKSKLTEIVDRARAEGARVAGYGADGKTVTFIHECGWQDGGLDFVLSENPRLEGTYVPGTVIPVRTVESLADSPADYLVVFSFSEADRIVNDLSGYAAKGGKFILPFPSPRVVTA